MPWVALPPVAVAVLLGLLSRACLSLSAAVHTRAAKSRQERQAATAVRGRRSSAIVIRAAEIAASASTAQVGYWVALALCSAGELFGALTVLLGGALVQPLLGAVGAAFDALARWLLLRGPRPRGRSGVGVLLAAGVAVLATLVEPPQPAWSGDRLWLATQQPLMFALLMLLAGVLAITEAGPICF